MVKISEALSEIIKSNAFLQFGIQHRLLNLSQTARYLQPLVAARTRKDTQTSALLMSLSRFQSSFGLGGVKAGKLPVFQIDTITVQSDLAMVTVEKSRETHRQIGLLYTKVQNASGYITISEGLSEITVIFDRQFLASAEEFLKDRPIFRNGHVAAVSAKFSERYARTPGFFFAVIQSLYMQGLNIIEVSSTTTEIIFYLNSNDVQLAFETLYNKFRKRS